MLTTDPWTSLGLRLRVEDLLRMQFPRSLGTFDPLLDL